MRLGAMLKAWRDKADLTVRDVAAMSGIPIATLSRVEHGQDIDGRTLCTLLFFVLSSPTTSRRPRQKEDAAR